MLWIVRDSLKLRVWAVCDRAMMRRSSRVGICDDLMAIGFGFDGVF